MITLVKLKILTPLQKMPKNVGDLGKLIIAPGFEKLPKSGHTVSHCFKDIFHLKQYLTFQCKAFCKTNCEFKIPLILFVFSCKVNLLMASGNRVH